MCGGRGSFGLCGGGPRVESIWSIPRSQISDARLRERTPIKVVHCCIRGKGLGANRNGSLRRLVGLVAVLMIHVAIVTVAIIGSRVRDSDAFAAHSIVQDQSDPDGAAKNRAGAGTLSGNTGNCGLGIRGTARGHCHIECPEYRRLWCTPSCGFSAEASASASGPSSGGRVPRSPR
jgi:hypothetical protein